MIGVQNVYEFTDKNGKPYTIPPRHWWKTRIGIGTAYRVAKTTYL